MSVTTRLAIQAIGFSHNNRSQRRSQIILLPAIAAGVIYLLHANAELAGGMILVAASPIAAISNYYALLARANVALAVTLTAFSSLVAVLAMPLIVLLSFDWLLADTAVIELPFATTLRQALFGLALPVAVGMLMRHFAPKWVKRHRTTLTRCGLGALFLLIAYILVDQAGIVAGQLQQIISAAMVFTLASACAGYAIGLLQHRDFRDRTALAIGFSIRNLGAAVMVAGTVLGRLDFVAFGALFFLSQLAMMLPLLLWCRRAVRRSNALMTASESLTQ